MAVLFKTQFIKGSLNAIDIIATIAGSPIFVQTEKGLAVKLVSGASLTYAIPSSNITNLISYIKGIGTYRVTLGATNIDVAKATFDYQFQNSAGTYNSVTTVVITATSGTVFVNRLVLLNGTNEVNQLQVEFNNAQPINKPKKGFVLNKPTDLSEYKGTGAGQGLVAAYNMQKVGNTLVDISGMGNTGTCVKTIATKNGLLFNGVDSVVNITGSSDLSTDTSYSIRFYMSTLRNYNALFQSGIGNYFWVDGGGSLKFTRNNSTFITIGTISAGWNTLTVTVTTSGITNCFINGVRSGSVDMATSSIISTTSWKWGYALNGNFLQGEIADGRIHNRILTLQEIKDYNNSFVQPTLVEDFSDAGADNQASVPREWTKTSGSFKVVENVIKQGELVVNGNFDTDTAWTKSAGVTISGGQLNIAAVNGDIAYQSIIAIGKRYKITYTITVVAGSIRSNFGGTGGNTGLLRTASGTYTEELSSLSTNGNLVFFATSTFTGSVDNVSVTEIQPLQTITNGTKYLEAITAGVVATPNNTAYGSWEFDWYKGGNNNTSFQFIDQKIENFSGNSYWSLFTSATNNIGILYSNAFYIMQSSASYVNINTWYRIKITRTATGLFTVLIKGGTFVPTAGYDGWTLVSVAGGLGTNPVTDNTYTTSNYFVMSLGAGDRVTNIKITNGLSSVSIPPTWLYGDNVLSQFWGDNLGLELWGDNL